METFLPSQQATMAVDPYISSGHTTGAVPSPRLAASSVTSVEADQDDMTVNRPTADPSVIVGMACRFPGATNTSQLWRVLAEKRDLQKKIPSNRFNVDMFHHPQGANKGTTNAKYGYFLDQGLEKFDNEFFRISGKEAESMDPQQRLLLEVVYEALENAGITLDDIHGTQTSVYCGSFSNDYNSMTMKDLSQYPKYAVTGNGTAILSNRISYYYNLHGPSLTVDTACSSSLVCFHLGNKSIQDGESEMSIVAGSALHFDPNIFITMTDFGMLSSDGRCRTFDANGSGYVRGEGVAAVILKRKSQAESAGDPIRSVIRGTGSNHDGLKDGLMLPNGKAQARLLQQTYKTAGLSTEDTDYFEAHGTGTKAGDPREAQAIGEIFASGRNRPLFVGSIKSNLGHLEGASGLAGIIKATMCVSQGKILPNMHFDTPNPEIDFEKLKISVPTEVIDWKGRNGLRRASVNSFGYGGSNAHVILENYRPGIAAVIQERTKKSIDLVEGRPFLLPLTSHSEKAAKHLTAALSDYVGHKSKVEASDLAYSLSLRRTMHRYRSFAIGHDKESIMQDLAVPKPTEKWLRVYDDHPKVGFVFTGQGAQWHAMGRQLIELSPFFRATLEECDKVLQRLPDSPDWTCIDELLKASEESRLSQSRFSQPICAALQIGIVRLLKTWGIEPSAVVGHSSGEIVAAYAAGILSFDNTIICAYYRGLYMSIGLNSIKSTRGAMMAVGLTESEGRAELGAYEGRICLAAINSPSSLTFSGDEDAILALQKNLEARKVFARRLNVEQAFHSHHMVPLAPAFERALSNTASFRSLSADIKLCSSVTARDSSASKFDASYWATNMTGCVRFSEALTGILLDENDEQNIDVLIEIGAHPALKGPSNQLIEGLNLDVRYIASLSREIPAFESLLATAGQLFALGYPVDLASVNSNIYGAASIVPVGQRLEDLPTYSWDHGSFWAETRLIREHRLRRYRHTLLGAPIPGGLDTHSQWRSYLRQNEISWLPQHVVDGKVVFPAAGYISMAIEAVAIDSPHYKEIRLRELVFKSALTISNTDAGTEVVTELRPLTTSAKSFSSSWYQFIICSFDENDKPVEHCHGQLCVEPGQPAMVGTLSRPGESFLDLQKSSNKSKSRVPYYKQLRNLGLDYGEDFQLLSGDIESGPGFSMAPLTLNPANVVAVPADECLLHPTVLDAAFHVVFAAIESYGNGKPSDEAFVPTFVHSMTVSGLLQDKRSSSKEQHMWVRSLTSLPSSRVAHSHISIQANRTNEVLVDMKGVEMTALGNGSEMSRDERSLFFHLRWMPAFDAPQSSHSFSNISDVLDNFAHQFPNCKILHLTPDLGRTRQILRCLGGTQGRRRRFQSITPYSASEYNSRTEDRKLGEWGGLCQFENPEEDSYDLIVASESLDPATLRYLRTDGFVICDNVEIDSEDLTKIFKNGLFSAWQKSAIEKSRIGTLTVLVSSQLSSTTQVLISAIQASYKGHISTMNIADYLKNPLSHGNIVSLISLDEDIFLGPSADSSKRFHLMQQLLQGSNKNVLFITRGATHESSNPAQALLLGLARCLRSENEEINIATLDIAQQYDVADVSKSIVVVFNGTFLEDEYALRDGRLIIPRLEINDSLNQKLPKRSRRQPSLEPFRQNRNLALKIGKVGLLDTLMFDDDEDCQDLNVGDNEVEIEVKASALNFRDIAVSMGIIDDYRLGDECSGIVIRTGRNVKSADFQPGDRVLACRPGQGAHKSIVRNPAILCHKIGAMDFVTATSFEGVATTAYYSLIDIARLQPNEFCLIHSAAGGVGQMAIQIAQMVGANVIATVGSQSKRDFLKQKFSLDDSMIFSSRDLSFVEGVLSVTEGRGVDVALNSLAGPLLHATWGCIAPFGRLIEIGKRDIHENTKLDMEPFRKNITYASVDLITLFHFNKVLLSRLIHDCFTLIEQRKIQPPGPIIEVPYAEAQKGFRLLQMGKQYGKVVLVPGEGDIVPVMPATYRNKDLFDPTRTYLLVGGLGGIGRSLAQWMYRRGARSLAFLSRSGTQRKDAEDTVAWLKNRDVQLQIFSGDVANLVTVENCIQSIGDKLAGIFQAAMVLRDIRFAEMSFEQWEACLAPKVRGTFNLHATTAGLDLDFFVCFSSCAAIVGSIAQANYSAANNYIDALMRHRRESGLAGMTMNVGAVTGIGAVAEDAALEKIMERLGYDLIGEEELFYQIEEAVISPPPSQTDAQVCGYDDHQIITGINLQTKDLYWATKSLFRNLYSNLDIGTGVANPQSAMSLSGSLKNAVDTHERKELLQAAFIDKVARVLAVPTATIQAGNPLSAYGLDSIVAVEFRKWFSQNLSVEVALFDILGARSIDALVTKVNNEIIFTADQVTNVAPTTAQKNAKKTRATSDRDVKGEVLDQFVVLQRPRSVPMSTFQSRLWFMHNLLEDQSALNLVTISRVNGQPSLDVLRQVIAELTRRNEILRTRYRDGEEFSEQIVLENFAAEIATVDVSSCTLPEAALDQYVRDARAIPLDIEQGELTRWTWMKLAEGKHAIILVCHHIALDNGSTKSFMDQFVALYNALHDQNSCTAVKAPKVSYLDFSVWQQHSLHSPSMREGIRWWTDKLHNINGPSSLLPFAKSHRPLRRSTTRQILRQTLGRPLLKRLKRICAQSNVTPFQFILTAFRAFIHRYTQEDDLTILMIDGNRPHPDLDDVLGFFVNIVPLRCQNQCDTSFDALLKDIKDIALEALAHNNVPFDTIVETAKIERTSSHFPIGQIAFNYQMYGKPPKYSTADFTIEDFTIEDIPTACEIQLEALEDPESGINFRFEYDSLLYGLEEMERFFDNFMTFVESVVKDHLQPIEEIQMCGRLEIEHLRENCWADGLSNNTWEGQTICARIRENANAHPEKTAVLTSSGQKITYRDLYHSAETVAGQLQASGVIPGQCVGISCYPGIDMVVAMIGIALSRCSYLPLDPSFATGRISHMIRDSSTSVILTSDSEKSLKKNSTSSIEWSSLLSISSAASTPENPPTLDLASANDPFYIIYTSGSTGKPKGVLITHANTQAMLSSLDQVHHFNSEDVFLFHSSMSFDLSVVQIWGALTSGATVALATQDTRNDPFDLARFMRDATVTVTYFPATQFALLLEHNSEDLRECNGWRLALFAGEYLPVRLVKSIYDLQTPVTVYNQWGPTETTAQTTFHKALYPSPTDINLPIGLPMLNCSHYIVNRRLRPVPASVVGELCIGGAQVGRGYLNRPEATEQVFIDNPFASEAFRTQGWNKLYKTGDTGRFLPDGQIDFKGRIAGDKQIKLRGQRIDLAEIENEIYLSVERFEAQKLVNVVVLPRTLVEDDSQLTDNRSLIAYIVPSRACTLSEQQILVNSIHNSISSTLNEYMLPKGYQTMNTLSTLISEKIDRQMLLKTELNLIFPSQIAELGEDGSKDDQQVLASVIDAFKNVLKLAHNREVTPTENFFDLGGQSILVLRLRATLKQKLGVDIPLPRLFERPTPLGIARELLGYSSNDDKHASKVLTNVKAIDWNREATLPPDACYYPQSGSLLQQRSQFTDILVTGVESFIGIHLLGALFSAFPAATFHVLGSQVQLIPFDLSSSFDQWKLCSDYITPDTLQKRVRYIPGTLSMTHFGLDDYAFQHLGRNIQAIYHVGVQVSLLKTYTDLKRLNVGSTLDIIELAHYGRSRTEIHYLSTWSVSHLQSWSTSCRTKAEIDTTETSPSHYTPGGGEELGYFKSRWVAEMLLNEAADRGFQVSIYRASAVTATKATQLPTQSDNLTRNMVLDMIELGIVPDLGDPTPNFSLDFVTVDYLASVMAQLSSVDITATAAQENLKYYHIGNPAPLRLSALPSLIPKVRRDGAPGAIVPLSEWALRVRERAGGDDQAQLEMSVLKEFLDLGHVMFSLDSTRTRQALEKVRADNGSMVECPPVDEVFLRTLISSGAE